MMNRDVRENILPASAARIWRTESGNLDRIYHLSRELGLRFPHQRWMAGRSALLPGTSSNNPDRHGFSARCSSVPDRNCTG